MKDNNHSEESHQREDGLELKIIQDLLNSKKELSQYKDIINQVLGDYTLRNKVVLTLLVRTRLQSIEKMLQLTSKVEDELLNNSYRISKSTSTRDLVKLYGEINKQLVVLLSLVQELDKDDIKNIVGTVNVLVNQSGADKTDIESIRDIVKKIQHRLGI